MVKVRSRLPLLTLLVLLFMGVLLVAPSPASANHPACGYIIVVIDGHPYPVPIPQCEPAHCDPGINVGPESEGGWPVRIDFFICLNP